MKKAGVLLLVLLIAVSFVIAQNNETPPEDPPENPSEGIDKAYQCLEDIIDEKSQEDLSLQDAVFSTLALGSESKLKDVIKDNKKSNEDCWPKSSCTLKDTAQVVLAYDRINKNTNDIEDWLLSKNETATELTWYLEIDISNHIQSECTLMYRDDEKTITVKEDMTLSGNPGTCFTISSSGFWLKVRDTCIGETFRISCDQDFITSLLYQRQGSSTIFVSPNTHSSSASGTTEETINSQCFKLSGNCDYEGTLWASLALDHTDHEISSFLPYLLAFAPENKRVFPSTFLYIFTLGQDQYSEIVQSQKQEKYWEAPNTKYNKFYDTALAMLSLQGSGAQELSNAQTYLLDIQTPEGCWNNNNVRDTAFLLYAGWPTSVPGETGPGSPTDSCIQVGRDCTPSLFACADIGGSVLDYDCDFGVCCSVTPQLQTCSQKNGIVCSSSQTCSGSEVPSLDGSCCVNGACQELPQENECELGGGSCEVYCTGDEETSSLSCGISGDICCFATTDDDESSNVWLWVIILLILVILLVIAIIFRKKLQLLFFKLRNRNKGPKRPGPPGRRGPPGPPMGRRPFPPAGPGMMKRPAPRPQGPPRGVLQRRSTMSKSDKELEETLKKLKEIGK